MPRQIGSPERLARIKSVAVIAAFEDHIGLGYMGLTVFNNKSETVPVDWNVSGFVQDRIAASLRGRYEIKPFAYDVAAFRDADTSSDLERGTADEVAKRLKTIATPGLADIFVIAVAGSSGHLSLDRYGMFVGITYTIDVFDGHTLQPIAQSFGGIPCERTLCLSGYEFPERRVAYAWRGEPYARLPAATRDDIRTIVFDLLRVSVPNTLGRLRLIAADR